MVIFRVSGMLLPDAAERMAASISAQLPSGVVVVDSSVDVIVVPPSEEDIEIVSAADEVDEPGDA